MSIADLGMGDPPIIIGDGSLKLTSNVDWANWGNLDSKLRRHGNPLLSIQSITVTSPALSGGSRTFPTNGHNCRVIVAHPETEVVAFTNNNHADLHIRLRDKNFSDFAATGPRQLTLASDGRITEVTVRINEQPVHLDVTAPTEVIFAVG